MYLMSQILNIAGYKFITLTDLPALQAKLLTCANQLQLKGTILLSAEGINLNVAGTPISISAFLDFLQRDACFADMTFRESHSDEQPFNTMKIKLKKEIITLRQSEISPQVETAAAISPQEFKQWLDEDRDLTILDVRNDYEIRFGTFQKAEQLH